MKNKLMFSLLLFCLVLASPSAFSKKTSYSEVYLFGDSLMDQGNVSRLTGGRVPGADYYLGRFSNGPVMTDRLSELLNLPTSPLFQPVFWVGRLVAVTILRTVGRGPTDIGVQPPFRAQFADLGLHDRHLNDARFAGSEHALGRVRRSQRCSAGHWCRERSSR